MKGWRGKGRVGWEKGGRRVTEKGQKSSAGSTRAQALMRTKRSLVIIISITISISTIDHFPLRADNDLHCILGASTD